MPTPYTDLEKVKEVKGYRELNPPMPFRAISKKMGKNINTIYRWYLQGIGKRKMHLKIEGF